MSSSDDEIVLVETDEEPRVISSGSDSEPICVSDTSSGLGQRESTPKLDPRKRPAKRCYDDLDDPDSPELEPQKKLCRLYFLDRCPRGEQCYFMHSDFPCKFYHFGFGCRDGHNCKLLHGRALDEEMKQILWNHVTTAPANLMQRFPCFPNVLLRKNLEDRHNELLQLEQEGLLDSSDDEESFEDISNPISSTLLAEIIKTATNAQLAEHLLAEMSELKDILNPQHIAALGRIGVKTKEQLFQLGASSLLELGFEDDVLVKIGNFKESQRRQSIYSEETDSSINNVSARVNDANIFGLNLDTSLVDAAPLSKPALSDQELYSILNDEREAAKVDTSQTSHNDSLATTLEGSPSTFSSNSGGSDELRLPASVKYSGVARIGSLLDLGYSLSELETIAQEKGIILTPSFSAASAGPPSEQQEDESNDALANSFTSDASSEENKLQFTLLSGIREKEIDVKGLESLKRTVEQLNKMDSLVKEQRDAYNRTLVNEASNDSTASGSDSDGQITSFRLPFKSIMKQYTPATEIDASNGRYPLVAYKLVPIDIPKPNFEHIRQSFVTEPTYSLDPRLQLMFNIPPTEVRPVPVHASPTIRDPRLNKQKHQNATATEAN